MNVSFLYLKAILIFMPHLLAVLVNLSILHFCFALMFMPPMLKCEPSFHKNLFWIKLHVCVLVNL